MLKSTHPIVPWDTRRDLIIPGDEQTTIAFCAEYFAKLCIESIKDHDNFFAALSGGSTPQPIFHLLTHSPYAERIPWQHVHLFWSDERNVPPTDPMSNFCMAMEAGFAPMPIPPSHIHRMHAECNIAVHAQEYEKEIRETLQEHPFDIIMLGLGEDGHIASLFPDTQALHIEDRWVTENCVPQKDTWRMTMTFPCLAHAKHTVICVLGVQKRKILHQVLHSKDKDLPAQRLGTITHKVLWIADKAAAGDLFTD